MLAQELFFAGRMAFTDLAQHPARRLMNQVFSVAEQQLRELERIGKLALFDEMKGRDDTDASLP